MASQLVQIVCGVVIYRDGKYLLIQEKLPKAYGKWNLPAGHVDEGETLEDAAIREAKEETGLTVILGQEIYSIHYNANTPVFHAFVANTISGEVIIPEDEILDAKWYTYEEVIALKDELRGDFVLTAVERHHATLVTQ